MTGGDAGSSVTWGEALRRIVQVRGIGGASGPARRVGVSDDTASRWFAADAMPTMRMGNDIHLAEAIGVRIDDLRHLPDVLEEAQLDSDDERWIDVREPPVQREGYVEERVRTYAVPAGSFRAPESDMRHELIERLLQSAFVLPDDYLLNLCRMLEAARRASRDPEAESQEHGQAS